MYITRALPKLGPSSTHPEFVATTSAPELAASFCTASWTSACESAAFSFTMMISVPSGNVRPFCVNFLSVLRTRSPARSDAVNMRAAAVVPHGTR